MKSVSGTYFFRGDIFYLTASHEKEGENRSRMDRAQCVRLVAADGQLGKSDRRPPRHPLLPFLCPIPLWAKTRTEGSQGGGRDRLRRSASPRPSPFSLCCHLTPTAPPLDYLTVKDPRQILLFPDYDDAAGSGERTAATHATEPRRTDEPRWTKRDISHVFHSRFTRFSRVPLSARLLGHFRVRQRH